MTDLDEHHIDMQGAPPVRQKPQRMSPKMFEFARGEVDKLLKGRMCFDYRDVNKAMKKDAYLIPNMDAILDRLRNARYISKVDLRQAYYQVYQRTTVRAHEQEVYCICVTGIWTAAVYENAIRVSERAGNLSEID